MPLSPSSELRPTLWRTCRALANRRRLAVLRVLASHPELSVSAIARALGIPLTTACEYLRALNARGLLLVRRVGRCVYYRLGSDPAVPDSGVLLEAVSGALGASSRSVEPVYRVLTACTHPRRVDLLRVLHRQPMNIREMAMATGASVPALRRHVRKLKARGLVDSAAGRYRCRRSRDPLARTLLRLAAR